MLRLGIDVDGVVADFRSAFRALAERELGIAAEDAESDLTKARAPAIRMRRGCRTIRGGRGKERQLPISNFQLPRALFEKLPLGIGSWKLGVGAGGSKSRGTTALFAENLDS